MLNNYSLVNKAAPTSARIAPAVIDKYGPAIAVAVMLLWLVTLSAYLLYVPFSFSSPVSYLGVLLITHLYTGLFITAHDAMHGTVSTNKKLNKRIGQVAAGLFAFNSYNQLINKHHDHHRHVATAQDPDYHNGHFFSWYWHFLKEYISWQQVVLMAITFNVLKLVLPTESVVAYWMLPAVLSTLQLFYFGTYLPHRKRYHTLNKHKAGSQRLNHLWAFSSCYFFGYHYEHHLLPATPWWQLWKVKERVGQSQLAGAAASS